MDISSSFLKMAAQYNQLNQYIDKSQITSEKNNNEGLVETLEAVEENAETTELEEKSSTQKPKQQEISQSVKDMIEAMGKEKAKLFNTGCSERCGEPKTILTVLERIEKDKDYDLEEYLEDIKELNIKGKAKKDLDTLYHMRKVEVDKYDECECEERKKRAKKLGIELKEHYSCTNNLDKDKELKEILDTKL